MVFYGHRANGYQYWVCPEKFEDLQEKERLRQRSYQVKRKDKPSFRQKKREYMKKYRDRRN